MNVSLNPGSTTRFLAAAGAALVMAGIVGAYLRIAEGIDYRGLVWLFDLSNDSSFPTWYSSLLLLAAALLAFVTSATVHGAHEAGDRRCWIGTGLILAFLSADEVARFHEWTGNFHWLDDRAFLGRFAGFFYYGWVVVGLAAVVVASVFLLPFVLRQTRQLKLRLLAAGATFVGGALLVEMINAWLNFTYPEQELAYMFSTAFEESLEIAGVLILIHALLDNARQSGTEVNLHFAANPR